MIVGVFLLVLKKNIKEKMWLICITKKFATESILLLIKIFLEELL